MQILIVEDEKPSAERLVIMLKEYDPNIEIVGRLESVEETIQFLNTRRHPDLLLVDIHLSDGHSFDIFKQVDYNNPIIFTTAFDNYVMDAFKFHSIDYILKPVTKEALSAALNKFKSMANCFTSLEINQAIAGWEQPSYKQRFLGKIGQRLFFIKSEDISFFRADNKIVFLVDRTGTQYIIDYTLEKLDELLNPTQFFRVNRSYLINYSSIQQIKCYFNNRLRLILDGANAEDEIILSRDRVPEFKAWADS